MDEANEMRLGLIHQIDELIDIADSYEVKMEHQGDFDEAARVRGAVAHARKVASPYRYNGASEAGAKKEPDGPRHLGKIMGESTMKWWGSNIEDRFYFEISITGDDFMAAHESLLVREIAKGGFKTEADVLLLLEFVFRMKEQRERS